VKAQQLGPAARRWHVAHSYFDWKDGKLVGVEERPYQRTIGERIACILTHDGEGTTEAEIVSALIEDGEGEVKSNSVNKWLNRQKDRSDGFKLDISSRRWSKP
jgi:hypothetical protein